VRTATIKIGAEKDKEFALVGSFFGKFSHRRNKRPPNAQVKGGENLTPFFSSRKTYPLSQNTCIFGPRF
jgi:hypothetical protein